MKTVIASIFVLMIYAFPSFGQSVEPFLATTNASILGAENLFLDFHSPGVHENLPGERENQSSCPQTNTYSVRLTTLSGQTILASQAQPNTNYRIVITYTGNYVCCANPAYVTTLAFGFSDGANDASNGNTTISIRTDPVLPPFGIIGVVGPTDCSGSRVSAENSPATQREIP